MFNVSIGDRLKAAVNQLEATGTSLQARATASLQPGQGANGQTTSNGAPTSPSAVATERPLSPKDATSPVMSPVENGVGSPGTSPSRSTYTASAAHLADSAFSGLSGLRKSFNFRPSLEGGRPSAAQLNSASPTVEATSTAGGPQELQDMPTSPPAGSGPSRSGSPARFLSTTSFGIGSDPSTAVATPHAPRSPGLGASAGPGPSGLGLGISRLRSPATISTPLPPPNPDDPASYPLPPSPTPITATLHAPAAQYADPLGASPLLNAASAPEPPEVSIELSAHADTVVEKANPTAYKEIEADAEILAAEQTVEALGNGEEVSAVKEENATFGEASALQSQIDAANKLLRELTPLDGGIEDIEALEGWIKMIKGKVDIMGEEMTRLRGQLALQESRIDELRDTHRLEGTSQSGLITKLRAQLSTAESNLAVRVAELSSLNETKSELTKVQTQVKEEEEKRAKAIQLLKTVRLKLVKAEKDKEEVERDRAEERAERSRAQDETERVRAEKEREVSGLRRGFERELASAKDRLEREMKEKKAAWELEMITTKASHARDLSNKTTMVNGLEEIVKELSKTKDDQFHTIQARQAEAESARAEAESLENRTRELEFQLREANERIAVLEDTSTSPTLTRDRGRANGFLDGRFAGSPSPSPSRSRQNSGPSPAEMQRVVAEAEARAESKLGELRSRIRSLEKDRNELEEEWGTKVQERVRESESLKRRIQEMEQEHDDSLCKVRDADARVRQGEQGQRVLEKEINGLRAQLEEKSEDVATAQEAEKTARDELSQIKLQLTSLKAQVEDQKTLVSNLRQANKTLREELRKVQSSVQLMERSRNPGVGYWSSAHQHAQSGANSSTGGPRSGSVSGEVTPGTEPRRSLESVRTDATRRTGAAEGTPNSNASPAANEEEEVNLEYLRNVILQFLEHPHMRRQLVQVLSVILHFTPQELRRLNAKVTA